MDSPWFSVHRILCFWPIQWNEIIGFSAIFCINGGWLNWAKQYVGNEVKYESTSRWIRLSHPAIWSLMSYQSANILVRIFAYMKFSHHAYTLAHVAVLKVTLLNI